MRSIRNFRPLICVDDDEDDRMLFKDAIEELFPNLDFRLYNNGIDLMDGLIKDIFNLPRLILLDLNMPFKNGYECIAEIRSNANLRRIPIAVYSTSSNESDKIHCLQLGATHYLTKSNSFVAMKNQLSDIVKNYLD